MAILITTVNAGNILLQSGHGVPVHVAPKGSHYTDVDTAIMYINKDGLNTWAINVDSTNSGATSSINSFPYFSAATIGQNVISATTSTDTISFSGINIDILTDEINKIITFSADSSNTYTFNGGTVTGDTNFTNGLTANTISATTYYNLPKDVYVTGSTYDDLTGIATFTNTTGGTFNLGGLFKSSDDIYTTGLTFNPLNYDLNITRNDGTSLTQNLAILASDMTVTGGTYNPSNGVATFTNNTGGTFTVSGFLTGMTDTYVTGFTYSDNLFTIKQNGQLDLTANIDNMTGLTVNGNMLATIISATTYYNLPTDIYTTGGTYDNYVGTATFTNNTGGTFNVSGFFTGQTDTYVTGLTYTSNIFTLKQTNNQPDLSVLINVVSGLTASTLYTDYIDFNTNYTGATTQGRISWDNGTGTLNIGVGDVGGSLIDLQVGQEEVVRVFNSESTTLLKGEIVYVDGSQGNRPSVKRAIATSDGYSVTTLGMVDVNIPSGAEGYVTTFGIISNLNTLGLSGGTAIWLSPTVAGGYTSIKPQAPYHTVLIGYVVRVAATVGSIFINISNGWEIDELHDVRMNGKAIGDLISLSGYNGSNVWVNTKTLNGSYTITGDTTVGGQMKSSTISATTYYNLPTDIYTTGSTYNNNTFTFTNNTGGTFNVLFNSVTGLTSTGTISSSVLSATTYLNLPIDVRVTGGTYNAGTAIFTNNTGGTFSVSGFKTDDLVITGGTYSNSTGVATFTNNTGGTFNVSGFFKPTDDIYTTGMTFNNGTYNLSIGRNDGTSFSQSLAILASDMTVTGGTYNGSTGVATFTNNSGGTFSVSGFLTGMTDTYTTGVTFSNNVLTVKRNASQPDINTLIDNFSGLTINGGLSATTISATTYLNLPADLWTQNGTSIYYNTGNVGIGITNPSRTFEVVDGANSAYFNLTGTSGPLAAVITSDFTKLARFNVSDGSSSISVGLRTSGETANPGFGAQNDTYIYANTTANGLNIINAPSTGNGDYIRLYAGLTANQGQSHLHVQGSGSTKGFIGINTENPIARLHVSGNTLISGGLTATTISATTYLNLPTDISVTGGTYSSGITTFRNNTGGTFTVTGFSTGNTTLYLYAESSTAPSVGPIVNGLSSIAMGDSAKALSDYMFVYGNLAGNSATGTTNSSFIGYKAGYQASDAIYSNFIGRQAGDNSTNLTDSNFMGRGAGLNATGSSYSNFVGSSAGQNATGATYSNFIGRQAGQDATVLTSSNFIGTLAGASVNTSNYSNFIGHQAGYSATSATYSNFIGFQAGKNTTGVTSSNLFGFCAGETFVGNNIGSNNIIIGTNISLPNATANSINIGGVLFGTNTYSSTIGNPSITPTFTGRIGIGIVTPSERLHISGNTLNWGNLTVTGNTYLQAISGTSATLSGSGQSVLTVVGSGNSTSSPIFSVQGSSGELFSVTDSLTGSLFSVNDISGLPIVEVFSDNTMLVGSYQAPALNTTVKTILTAGTNTIYSIPTSAYTGSFIDYTVISSGATGARAGTIMSIWSGTTAQYTDVSTNDIGTTAGITFLVSVVGNNAVLSSSATTAGWTLKTIIRSI